MIAVSGVLIFAGYQLLTYGWSQIQGENAGFFDLLWPGRYTGKYPLDSAGATSSSSTPGGLGSGSGAKTVLPGGLKIVPPNSVGGFGKVGLPGT